MSKIVSAAVFGILAAGVIVGQSQRVRDLLVFQQQGGTWIAEESTEVLQKALHECRNGR